MYLLANGCAGSERIGIVSNNLGKVSNVMIKFSRFSADKREYQLVNGFRWDVLHNMQAPIREWQSPGGAANLTS